MRTWSNRRLPPQRPVAVAVAVALTAVALPLALSAREASSRVKAPQPPTPTRTTVVTVADAAATAPVPRSFLGLSAEYEPVPMWERSPRLFDRVVSLLRPREGGPLVLRIGGDSADQAFWDPRGARLDAWAIPLTPAWLRSTRALVRHTAARLILDLNLVTGSPAVAARWARAAAHGLPRHSIAAYEVGNEPDIYNRRAWLQNTFLSERDAPPIPRALTSRDYDRAFRAYAGALAALLPADGLAGPALAHPAVDTDWVTNLLADAHPDLGAVTTHIYPLSACARPGTRRYPTIARVLSEGSTVGRARAIEPGVLAAHRAGLAYRVTEINSVTCSGLAGVSNAFATALWAPQTLFALLRAGVDGANIHVRDGTVNAAFALDRRGLTARPLLYGLILFERMLGPGARLARVGLLTRAGTHLETWAVRVGRSGLHVLVLNPSSRSARVDLRLPAAGTATVHRLLAPSLGATTGVTLDRQRIGPDGRWRGRSHTETVARRPAGYELRVPGASAALVEVQLTSATEGHRV